MGDSRSATSGFEIRHPSGSLEVRVLGPGVVAQVYVGEIIDAYFQRCVTFWTELFAEHEVVYCAADLTAVTGYGPNVRQEWTKWLEEHRARMRIVLLLESPIHRMAANAVVQLSRADIRVVRNVGQFRRAIDRALEHRHDSVSGGRSDRDAIFVSTVEDDDELIGSVIDDAYEIRSPLSFERPCTLYRGQQLSLGREVAIKLLRQHPRLDPKALPRFRREVDVIKRLSHPNIVQVIDARLAEQGGYLITELLEGDSLRQFVPRGGLEPAVALELFGQLCSGVAAIHAARLVHLDLGPASVQIVEHKDGSHAPKILGLGLATLPEAETEGEQPSLVGHDGEPGFAAPERLAREPRLDARVDVYALASLFYFMLSRQLPFGEGSPGAVRAAQLGGDLQLVGLSGRLKATLGRALSPDREERPASVRELREAIEAGAALPFSIRPRAWRRGRFGWLGRG